MTRIRDLRPAAVVSCFLPLACAFIRCRGLRRLSGRDWQPYDKFAAVPLAHAAGFHRSSMQLSETFDYREADTEARRGPVTLVKHVEDMGEPIRGNAVAGILHAQDDVRPRPLYR